MCYRQRGSREVVTTSNFSYSWAGSKVRRGEKVRASRGRTRPGGRTERVRKAVLDAVLRRLETGDIEFSFQDIAKASGVHVATIYARWPERTTLIMAAYGEHARKLNVEVTGHWKSDLHRIGIALRDFLNDPVEIAANKLLIVSGDPEYKSQMVQYGTSATLGLAATLIIAKGNNKIRPDVDPELIVGMLTTHIVSLIMFAGQVPNDREVYKIVDHLIHSCIK